jgi:hypothetical protein
MAEPDKAKEQSKPKPRIPDAEEMARAGCRT